MSTCRIVAGTATPEDMVYGSKLQRIERQLHCYGSGLNALPLISEIMSQPPDEYPLQIGFA
ncbi:hypothetical protein FRC06_003415, partial [Ceratobasidium sp. 370]